MAIGDLPSGSGTYGIKRTRDDDYDLHGSETTQETPSPSSTSTSDQQETPNTFNRVASHPLLQNIIHNPFDIGQDVFAAQNMHQWQMDNTLTPGENLLASLYPGLEFDRTTLVGGNTGPVSYPPMEMLNALSMWNHVPSGYESAIILCSFACISNVFSVQKQ